MGVGFFDKVCHSGFRGIIMTSFLKSSQELVLPHMQEERGGSLSDFFAERFSSLCGLIRLLFCLVLYYAVKFVLFVETSIHSQTMWRNFLWRARHIL